jgi:hypothetical protein
VTLHGAACMASMQHLQWPTRPHTYARRCIPLDPPRCRANIHHCVRTAHALPGEARVNDRGQPASNRQNTLKEQSRTRVCSVRVPPTSSPPQITLSPSTSSTAQNTRGFLLRQNSHSTTLYLNRRCPRPATTSSFILQRSTALCS